MVGTESCFIHGVDTVDTLDMGRIYGQNWQLTFQNEVVEVYLYFMLTNICFPAYILRLFWFMQVVALAHFNHPVGENFKIVFNMGKG